MEIKPTYVSFEQAKWLFEKGFKGIQIDYGLNQMLNNSKTPEQWQVVEWLRINHGIWLYVKRGCEIRNNEAFDKFQPIIEFIPQIKFDITDLPTFDSPQEAYSAAFDFIKQNNLI